MTLFSTCLLLVAACGSPDPDAAAGDAGPNFTDEPTVVSGVTVPLGTLALDQRCLYFAVPTGLYCLDLSSNKQELLATFDLIQPIRMRVHGDWIYGTGLPIDFGPESRGMNLWRVPRDGGAFELLAQQFSGAGAGRGLVVDDAGIYFTTGGSADLYRLDLEGGTPELLASESGNMGDLALHDGALYYGNGPTLASSAVSNDGDDGQRVADLGLQSAYGIVSADADLLVYGTTLDENENAIVYRVSSDGGKEMLATVEGPGEDIAVADGSAFLTANGVGLVEVSLSTGEATTHMAHDYAKGVVASDEVVAWLGGGGQLFMMRR